MVALKAHYTYIKRCTFRSGFGSALRAKQVWETGVYRIPFLSFFCGCRVPDCAGLWWLSAPMKTK